MGLIQPDGKKSFTILERSRARQLQSFIMKSGNAVGSVGAYSPKAMRNRIEKYKKKANEKKP